MPTQVNNSKRIAKNTSLLYFRMILMMAVNLYTSRVVLNALGVNDYGVYNVVGGFVSLFNILTGSLSAAVSRFITFELGKGDKLNLNRVFCTSVNVQLIFIGIIVFLMETVGLGFLNFKMVIPEDRIIAANWVFQFSVLAFAVNLWSVPYNASIIAHEKMSAFAYISLFDAFSKLLIAFIILYNPIDRLVYYGLLIMLVYLSDRIIYSWYCKKHFEECTYYPVFDKQLLKKMLGFAGWNFLGAGSGQLMTQGVNMLFNVYFGVVVNAARGIADIVDSAVMQFVNNFTVAINPQITKSYAVDDKKYMFELMFRGAKFSFFLIMIVAIPILCNTDFILSIWLGVFPEHAVNFVRLALLVSMISVLSNTMVTAMLATGDIKKYQIIVGGLGMLVFPFAWLLFFLGMAPETAYMVTLSIFILQLICRLFLLREMVGMSIREYFRRVLLVVSLVVICATIIPAAITLYVNQNLLNVLLISTVSVLCSVLSIWFIGLDSKERIFIFNAIRTIKNKI